MPKRIQRRRAKGCRLPPNAVYVGRPSPLGNPFPWRGSWIVWAAVARGFRADVKGRRAAAVAFYREWLVGEPAAGPQAGVKSDDLIVYESGVALSTAEAARSFAGFAASSIYAIEIQTARPSREQIESLRGKDLACWCRLCPAHADGKPMGVECADCEPCHVDPLLELANRPYAQKT